MPTGTFENPKPHTPRRDPSGSAAAMGCPRSVQPHLEPRGSLLSNHEELAKNEEEEKEGEIKKIKVKSSRCV
jgi:hypothetical protein